MTSSILYVQYIEFMRFLVVIAIIWSWIYVFGRQRSLQSIMKLKPFPTFDIQEHQRLNIFVHVIKDFGGLVNHVCFPLLKPPLVLLSWQNSAGIAGLGKPDPPSACSLTFHTVYLPLSVFISLQLSMSRLACQPNRGWLGWALRERSGLGWTKEHCHRFSGVSGCAGRTENRVGLRGDRAGYNGN